jgi:ribosome biogenesis GTPase
MHLNELGYDAFFENKRTELGLSDLSVGRVVSEARGAYQVRGEAGEYLAKVTGKRMFTAASREDYPAVGDWVAIEVLGEESAVIHAILPRRTMLQRKYGDRNRAGEKERVQVIATNIDAAFIVESVDRDYSLNRFERYRALAESGGVRPVLLLNKTDLLSAEELDARVVEIRNRFPGVDVIPTSAVRDGSLEALRAYMQKGKTYCFLGSSGVGKSSIINALFGTNAIPTRVVSSISGRGQHTTTRRQMYFLENGGIVIDNPGMREVGTADAQVGIDVVFNDIIALAPECRYADCAHLREPGCAVIRAVKEGKVDEGKYENYLTLRKEAEYTAMSDIEKREKDRQFGKFVKKAKKEVEGYKS